MALEKRVEIHLASSICSSGFRWEKNEGWRIESIEVIGCDQNRKAGGRIDRQSGVLLCIDASFQRWNRTRGCLDSLLPCFLPAFICDKKYSNIQNIIYFFNVGVHRGNKLRLFLWAWTVNVNVKAYCYKQHGA